jgi:polysaccharide biosynthesis protein PelD
MSSTGRGTKVANEAGVAKRTGRRRDESGQSVPGDSPWARIFAPSQISRGRAAFVALEVTAVTLALFVVSWLIDPADPLLMRTGFGWAWLVPVVFGMRYGTLAGTGSGLLMLGAWYVMSLAPGASAGAGHRVFPGGFVFGGFVLTLLCGQFGDIWIGRQRQARIANDYLAERLSILTKNQFLLRLSHERLEQDLLARPATLRDSLGRLRVLALADEEAGPLKGAERFLKTAAQACQLETASLYAWTDTNVSPLAVASVGVPIELDFNDPLVTEAIDKLTLAHPQTDAQLDVQVQTRYRADVPMLDAAGRHVALMVVERMPFLAMTRDNLQFLAVLCGYYADGVRHAELSAALIRAFPRCPYEFALEYVRLVHLVRDTGVQSSLVALVFDTDELSTSLHQHILRSRRSLDAQWSIVTPSQRIVLTLMPLSGESAVAGYLLRIEENMRAQFATDFEAARVATHSMRVTADSPVDSLRDFLRLCHVEV